MSQNKVKNLWGRKFHIVKEGLDENQIADFVDEIMEQRDTLLAERKSLLAYIRPYKSAVDKQEGSPGQQTENTATGIMTEVVPDTQPQMEATELDQTMPPALPEVAEAETGQEEFTHYQGEVELAILPPVDAMKLLQFERNLVNSFDLKLVSIDGAQSKGVLITVLLNEPQPLLRALRQMPEVEEAKDGQTPIPSQISEVPPWRFRSNQGERIWVTLSNN